MIVTRAATWINHRFGLRPLIWGGVLVLAALALDFVPLFDLLGFDFSFALGLGAAFAAPMWSRRGQRRPVRHGAKFHCWRWCFCGGSGFGAADAAVAAVVGKRLACALLEPARGSGPFYAPCPLPAYCGSARGRAGRLGRRGGHALGAQRLVGAAVSILWALLRLYLDLRVFALDRSAATSPVLFTTRACGYPAPVLVSLANPTWIATAVALAAV